MTGLSFVPKPFVQIPLLAVIADGTKLKHPD